MHKDEEQRVPFHCWCRLVWLARLLLSRLHHWELTSHFCCSFGKHCVHLSPLLQGEVPLAWFLYRNFGSFLFTSFMSLCYYKLIILIFQFVLWVSFTVFVVQLSNKFANVWTQPESSSISLIAGLESLFLQKALIPVFREFCVCLLLLVLPQFWVFSQQSKENYDLIIWFFYTLL